MKTIIELAREAGFVSAQFWPDDFKGLQASVERFAALVEAAHTDELLEGVEMPEPVAQFLSDNEFGKVVLLAHRGEAMQDGDHLFTADQLRETVAAAVAKKDAEIDTLKAENERLRADADCFNFWVHEAWHSPSAIMKLLNSCETPEDYRNKLLPIMEGRKAAIDAALKGQP